MKAIDSSDLVRLAAEVKSLIRDGVYSLYTVQHPSAAFLLVTSQDDAYLLASDGEVVDGASGASEVQVEQAVCFADPPARDSLHVNWI
ncbi:MAG TPA: hypothetical protein VHM70_13000 [Polyangiaceae bacterium]|jgi:hypothetical protein|nr:hypothetical protein [Polyangiaceae bacterium]